MEKNDFEVLLSTMNRNDISIINKMKVNSNILIINQSDTNDYHEQIVNNHTVRMYSFKEKGIGISRNNALMRSKSRVCMMADDDMIYVDGYEEIVKKKYEDFPDADMIIFNVRIHDKNGVVERVKKNSRVRKYNCLKYGTVSYTFKRDSAYKKNLSFSLLFGGGAKYSSGEDSLFLWDALKKGLKVYSSTEIIADVYNHNSSWFKGYNERYLFDRGALFKALSPKLVNILIIQFAVRRKKIIDNNISLFKSVEIMIKGSKEFSE